MKKFIILIPLILLVGCYQSVNSFDIERAIEACGSIKDIVEIHAYFNGEEFLRCKNLEKFKNLSGVVIK